MATPYPSESELLNTAVKFYKEVFGETPQIAAAAPGRVNLIGEHTDYNNGFVLPMALPLLTIMVGKRNELNRFRITTDSRNVDKPYFIECPIPALLNLLPTRPKWANYIIGVIAKFKEAQVPGFDAVVVSTVPVGGGLSSSAAMEVCTYTFLEVLTGVFTKDLKKKALVCQSAEHEFAGVPCGIMDQFISTMGEEGSALLIDCKSMEALPVPMTSLDSIVLVINSNVKHELATGEYGIRRKQCEEAAVILGVASLRNARKSHVVGNKSSGKLSDVQFRRARHVVGEIERTKDAATALARSDDEMFGQLMYESHEALSKDYEVSCPELDELVGIVKSVPGVYGSRMTGGGFGGCTVTLVKKESVNAVIETVKQKYSRTATFYTVLPSAGARQLFIQESNK